MSRSVLFFLGLLVILLITLTMPCCADDFVREGKAAAFANVDKNPADIPSWYLLAMLGLVDRDGNTAAKAGIEALNRVNPAEDKIDLVRGPSGLAAYFGFLFDNKTKEAAAILVRLEKDSSKTSAMLPLIKYLKHEPGALTPDQIFANEKDHDRHVELATFLAYDALLSGKQEVSKKFFQAAEKESYEELNRCIATIELKRMDPRHVPAPQAISKSIGVYDTAKIRDHLLRTSPALTTMLAVENDPSQHTQENRQKIMKLLDQADVDIAAALRYAQMSRNLKQAKDVKEYKGTGVDLTESVMKLLDQKYATLKW